MAGYSGTPLAKKLGIKDGTRFALVDAPPQFLGALAGLPAGALLVGSGDAEIDVLIAFCLTKAGVTAALGAWSAAITVDGALWFAWPKRGSGITSDLTEQVFRDLALPTGLVDNKVCAIDEQWSGLRFVWRRELRPQLRQSRQLLTSC